jgi:uncharacterized delta-60 repeat protein
VSRSRVRRGILAGLVLALSVAVGTALAAAGALDPSFSGDGKRLLDFNNGNHTDRANAVATSGGKVVLAGRTNNAGLDSFGLARLSSDGTPDHSFSGDGRRAVSFGSGFDEARGVAVQHDGKVVAAGHTNTSGAGFAITRLTADGDLDTSFSGDGKRLQSFGTMGSFSDANAVAIQADGKIVVAGVTNQTTGNVDMAVARFQPNGKLDASFSGDGKRTVSFADSSFADSVAIGPGGTIVLAGRSGNDDFAIARLESNGNMDSSFSGDGKVTVPFPSFASAQGVAAQGDGRVVAVGYENDGSGNYDFAITRFTEKGQLDSSFSGDGIRLQSFDNGTNVDEANSVALQRDGKAVVAGWSFQNATGDDFAIARFKSNGQLDASFSGDGRRLQSFDNGSNGDEANGVAIDSSGRIVVAGSSDLPGAPRDDFAIARYLGS